MQDYGMQEVAIQQGGHLEDAAAVYARRRFEGGSARHLAAMARFPASRRLELAPLRYLLPQGRSCLFDLFAGTGFASASIRSEFRGTFLLEPHVAAEDASIANSRRHRACALSAGSFDGLPAADLAVCLAGFHHVLGPGPAADRDSHRRQRLEALRLWGSRLAPSGRLVIADVPLAGTDVGWLSGDPSGLLPTEPSAGAAGDEAPLADALRRRGIEDYLAALTARCDELDLGQPEPSAFFDHVVAEQSPYGHVACFDSPQELADMFREAGYEHVRAFVAPTPWLFPSKADAVWFVRELLGIGQPCDRPSALKTAEVDSLGTDIRTHLDLRQVSEGVWAVAWKLMYVMGERP